MDEQALFAEIEESIRQIGYPTSEQTNRAIALLKSKSSALRSMIEKFVKDYAAASAYPTGTNNFTREESLLYRSLPELHQRVIREKGHNAWSDKRREKQKAVLEKYVTLWLEKHWDDTPDSPDGEEIRKQLTEKELELLDEISPYREVEHSAPKLWVEIYDKPEIQRLLAPPIQDAAPFKKLTDAELLQAAEQASQNIYSATKTGGLMIFAPSGWGKSRLLGRSICYQYAVNKIGSVTLDVVGATGFDPLSRIDQS